MMDDKARAEALQAKLAELNGMIAEAGEAGLIVIATMMPCGKDASYHKIKLRISRPL